MLTLRELKIILEENYTKILKYKITLSKYLHESSSLRVTQQYLDYGDQLQHNYLSKVKDIIVWYLNVNYKFMGSYQFLNRNYSKVTRNSLISYIESLTMSSKEKEFLYSILNSEKEKILEFFRNIINIREWSVLIEDLFDSIKLYKCFIDEQYVVDERIQSCPLGDSHELINEIFHDFDVWDKPFKVCSDEIDLLELVESPQKRTPNEEEIIWKELIESVFNRRVDVESYLEKEKNDPYLNLYLSINQHLNTKKESIKSSKRHSDEQSIISHVNSYLKTNNKKRKLIEDCYESKEDEVGSLIFGFC